MHPAPVPLRPYVISYWKLKCCTISVNNFLRAIALPLVSIREYFPIPSTQMYQLIAETINHRKMGVVQNRDFLGNNRRHGILPLTVELSSI